MQKNTALFIYMTFATSAVTFGSYSQKLSLNIPTSLVAVSSATFSRTRPILQDFDNPAELGHSCGS